jgi:hypothetical protein
VRISGGGRCNLTHACFDPKLLVKNYPRGNQALLGPFHAFQPKDTIAWFEKRGTPLKTEPDGRVFPATDTSFSIVTALKEAARQAGVRLRTNAWPTSIKTAGPGPFTLALNTGESIDCDRLLLATGSAADGHSYAAALGHAIVKPVPSLFTFTVPDERLRRLAGIAAQNVSLRIVDTPITQSGAVLITHWGLSGPAVLKLSAWGARFLNERNYNAAIEINWIGMDPKDALQELLNTKAAHPKKTVEVHALFSLPHRLWDHLVRAAGVEGPHRWADVSKIQMAQLTRALTANLTRIRGKSPFKEEFVTCGGVCLDEVNFKTMESRKHPGLYFAGEILDVDGLTGGFNFQNAWTTAWLAGRAMGQH